MKVQTALALFSLASIMLIPCDLSKEQCERFVLDDSTFDIPAFEKYWQYKQFIFFVNYLVAAVYLAWSGYHIKLIYRGTDQ